MAVSLSNRKRIKRQKGPLPKKNTTAPNKRRPLAPVRQRRGGGRYADTTSRASNGDGGMALLNAVRSQGKLEALHDQSLKTIGNLEMRVGKAEATLRHKLDGHRVERDGDIGMRGMPPTVPLHDDDGASPSPASPTTKTDTEMGTPPMPTPSPMGGTSAPNPGAKQQPAPRVARRTKSSMDVDSTSPSDFIQKRPSTSSLVQPTSSRARVDGGNGQLALSVAARAKPDRGRDDDDEVLGNKKPTSARLWDCSSKCDHGEWQKNASRPKWSYQPTSSTPTIHNRNRQRNPSNTTLSEAACSNRSPIRTDSKW